MKKKGLMMHRILLIEDEKYFRLSLRELLQSYAIVDEASTFQEAKEKLASDYYDVALIDIDLHGNNEGLELLKETTKKEIYSVILTDHDEGELIKKAYSQGANHYLTKNNCESVITYILKQHFSNHGKESLDQLLRQHFVTQDQYLRNEIRSIKHRMTKERPILILGESGTGKGALAKVIHQIVGQGEKDKFIGVNVAAISEQLAESELFGHVKGSFTGAHVNKKGKLELAHQGTLFLDEISTASLQIQQKLLKAIEDKSFFPVGADRLVRSDFLLISATSENLYQKVKDDLFRLDLFYRLNSITIEIPPLRERVEDIPLLVDYFLKRNPRRVFIDDQAMEALKGYYWPGNVRELKSTVEDLSCKTDGIVRGQDLPPYIVKNEYLTKECKKSTRFLSQDQVAYLQKRGLKDLINKIEVESIREAMEIENHKAYKAAQTLKISKTNFYRLYKKGQGESNLLGAS